MARTASDGLSIDQLEQMLNARRSQIQKLERQRSKIARKLDAIEDRIRQLGGMGRGGRSTGRARNEQSLIEVIEFVLKGAAKPLKVGDIVEAVKSRGYRSRSANFRGIVNQTLIKDKRFASASRGVYQLKK